MTIEQTKQLHNHLKQIETYCRDKFCTELKDLGMTNDQSIFAQVSDSHNSLRIFTDGLIIFGHDNHEYNINYQNFVEGKNVHDSIYNDVFADDAIYLVSFWKKIKEEAKSIISDLRSRYRYVQKVLDDFEI